MRNLNTMPASAGTPILKTKAKRAFALLLLLCAIAQGAWAQTNWDEVYAMTATTSADWTQLNGSTTGQTLGTLGTTTYYYADANLSFTNSTAGGSGMTILGTVYLYVPDGMVVTCAGADAVGQTGAGAGIELTAGNTLYLLGRGSVNATGGNAANGGNGGNGSDAGWDSNNYWSGTGGNGGNGGGGAGAGIGTRGGDGGNGGDGAANKTSAWSTDFGGSGSNGEAGATADAMGGLCVSTSFANLTATGGAAASSGGSGGSAGKSALDDDWSYNYGAAGGGGGGGGGFGGAASNIGTGGPGGGGGGGGASGNLDWTDKGYWVVKAPGGKGGQNSDGTWAGNGAESILNYDALNNGQAISNSSGWGNYDSSISSKGVGIGGSGSAAGNASTSESAININTNTALPTQEEWDVVCAQTNTSQSQWTALPFGTSMGATIGTAGATTYYYATGDRTFINANVGGSGLTIQGTVYLFIASGQTVTCKGANASGQTGAGAGIELTEGNVLFLLGQGNVNATGGNAAGGGNGGDGSDADWDSNNYWSGAGGNGGNGGGGAGAGIGTRGGDGGSGGDGAASVVSAFSTADGGSGAGGQAGATAGLMGELYETSSFGNLTATGGSAASTSGSAGRAGKSILDDDTSNNYGAAGGGGGGGGGFGGAASNIGTGGPGGGGGGGGASGNLYWAGSGYYVVKASGGKGGQNADGTWAAEGAESILNYNAINNGQVISNSNGWGNSDSYVSSTTVGTEGSGGSCGSASSSKSAIDINIELPTQSEWDKVCLLTNTNQNQWAALHFGSSTGATIGTAGTTTYYFATGDRSFTNSTVGGSGLTVLGTVYLFIPSGDQLTCTGANANGTTGGGAGIELTAGNSLYLIGNGTVSATGGNAANGVGGSNGGDASFSVRDNWLMSGNGGRGGNGGGGAGAGIGTSGGNGGDGGAGGAGIKEYLYEERAGNAGGNGANGGTAASMGTLYIYQMPAPTMEIHGGSGGNNGGNGGTGGLHVLYRDDWQESRILYWSCGGGGGGAGGGKGGAASNIGTGGPGGGGGGGGGGASGTITYTLFGYKFYQVGALGGNSGTNADGTPAGTGQSTLLTEDNENYLAGRHSLGPNIWENAGWYNNVDNRAAGGSGGDTGTASQSGSAIPVVMRTVEGYGESTASDHWAFIASPVEGSIEASDVGNIFSATQYDLYRFNPSADLEWENWKDNANFHFNLTNGRGYLYATKETKTLVFSGNYNTGDTKTIENLPQGFNLVGNPFIVDAYINKPYYTLNGDGSAILANPQSVTTPISPCHGVIVETDGSETVTFTTTAPVQQNPNNGGLLIALTQANPSLRGGTTKQSSILDNAIITFNEGTELGKYYFGTQAANISLPHDGKEYAIVSVCRDAKSCVYDIASVGGDAKFCVSTEVPVNFKAKQDGTYTLSFSLENMDADYLHLIDNLTGADVDLLTPAGFPLYKGGQGDSNNPQTASYTFTAKTTDYASRFRLVFSGPADGPSADEQPFAYYADGEIRIVADAHSASLQVVDVTGRVVFSGDALSGDAMNRVSTSGMTPGVYVLRLINGDDVKTQKIVVK